MAFTTVGFDGTVTETQFARLMRAHGEVGYKHGVLSGMATTVGGGTRQVSVAVGTSILPGLLVDSDAAVVKTLAANATAANRVDYVVLQADWATNTVDVVVVQGSSSTAPALTQTEGVLWQMPLARVTVRPSVSTFLSTDIVVCKPLPRVMVSSTVALADVTRAWNSAAFTVGTITLPDPGWPYRLQIVASIRFNGGTTGWNGYGYLSTLVNGAATGENHTEALANTGNHGVTVVRTTGVLSGPVTALAQIRPFAMTSPATLDVLAASSNILAVDMIPA